MAAVVSFAPAGLVVDMDGVLYRGELPMRGLRDFFEIAGTHPLILVTNNSLHTRQDCAARLRRMGVEIPPEVILTVSDATGLLVASEYPAGTRALVLGSEALRRAVAAAGMRLVTSEAELVVAGLDPNLSYASLTAAVRSVAAGAGFVATSLDPVLLSEDGIAPAAGSIVAAIRACVPTTPVLVGKPAPAMFLAAAGTLGLAPESLLVVGDNVASDIAGGRAVGARTVLLLTGISGRDDSGPEPDLILAGLPELTDWLGAAWKEQQCSS